MTPALLVVDLQRWYLEQGKPEKLDRVGALIDKTNELIDFFHEQCLPIVKVQNVHKKDGSTWDQFMRPYWTGKPLQGTLTEGTWEAERHPDVRSYDTEFVVTKTRSSAFIRTDLEAVLREQNVDAVVLAGYSINRCVGLTAIEAWERDFRVILAEEAIIGSNLADSEAMWNYLSRFGLQPIPNEQIREELSSALGQEGE